MTSPDELQASIDRERSQRRESEREIQAVRRLVKDEAIPLWERIRLRRQQNGFGEDYEIALTRRG